MCWGENTVIAKNLNDKLGRSVQFGKIPACKLGGEGVEVRYEGRAAVWREHLSQVRVVVDYNKQYMECLWLYICLRSRPGSPNVVRPSVS